MKLTLIKFMLMISMTLPFMKAPMAMGVLLLMYTVVSTLLISKVTMSSWMAMIMFLVFIGGLLILFMYMSSIASNEKFKPNLFMFMLILVLLLPTEEMISDMQINELLKTNSQSDAISLSKMYNTKTLMMTFMLFIYMFLTMLVVTSIVKIYKGPLRSSI